MQVLVQEGARVAQDPPDFDTWVAARGPGLLRLAYTLTGHRPDGRSTANTPSR